LNIIQAKIVLDFFSFEYFQKETKKEKFLPLWKRGLGGFRIQQYVSNIM